MKNPNPQLTNEENYVVELNKHKRDEEIRQKKKHVQIVNKMIEGKERRIGFISVNGYYNEVAEALYTDKELNIDLVVMLYGDRVSFRSPERSGIDCSKLAEKFGGGGNKNTGGCSMRNLLNNIDLLDIIIENFSNEIRTNI